MHQIFSVWEILRSIVLEYATLENNTWNSETQGNQYRHALLRLASVKVFSPFALELLWRDASIMQLSSLSFDWQALVQRPGGTPAEFLEPRDYIRLIKVVVPMFNLHEQPQETFQVLQASDAFNPLSMYCVPPSSRDFDSRREAMDRYGMLFKESLVDIFLYVEADQPFCWSPLVSRLPKGLRELSILPMIPLVKDADMGPALSFHETRNLLAAYTLRGDTLRTIELRCLHLDMTRMVLEELSRLPRLKTFVLAGARNRESFPVYDTEPATETEGWPVLENLHIRGYPLATANDILQTSQSTSLTTLKIQAPMGINSTPFSVISNTLTQKWTHSLVELKFEGQPSWNDDPVIDVDHIMQALASLVNLRYLYICCRHIMSHLHLQHLISIGKALRRLQSLFLVSTREATLYSSHLKLFDLVVLKPLPELLVVVIEMGQIRVNTPAEDATYPRSQGAVADSKINDIVVLSADHDSLALAQCSDLFPRVTMIEHMPASYVGIDSSESMTL